MWWTVEATAYDRYVYKPLVATPRLNPDSSLALTLTDPGWIGSRRLDDFVPDHGHVMHLFVLSPSLDRLWHLHPNEAGLGIHAATAGVPAGSTSCLPISSTPPASPKP
jgi:hypothetical protein